MLTTVSHSAERQIPFDAKDYRIARKDAEEAILRLTKSIEEKSDPDRHLNIEADPHLVEDARRLFDDLLRETDAVYAGDQKSATMHIEKARTIFDEIFEKHLNILHFYHQARLEALKIDAHDQAKKSDVLFYIQLVIILAAAIFSLLFSNKVLLKGFHVAEQGAFTDGLTGLHNRKYLAGPAMDGIAAMLRSREPFSLLLADVDHFKRFNDTFGHQAGDIALKEVAHQLRKGLRKTDILIRYGGEEFLAILPGADKISALVTANKVREQLAMAEIGLPAGKSERVTASFGLASFPEDDIGEYPALLKMVDERLYKAKADGRNKVVG
jgi:diguanylate cyclase (GGDEF)-like protein